MKTLELEGNDLKMNKESFVITDGEKEMSQSLEALLSIRKGEFALDEHVGMERENMLGKNPNFNEIRDDIIEALSQDERVELVEDITIAVANRRANINFKATIDDGQEVIEGVGLYVG